MTTRGAIAVAAAVCFAVSSWAATAPENEPETTKTTEVPQQRNADGAGPNKINVTVMAARLFEEYVTPTVCTYTPEYCTKHELHSSRGIQSYLATAGTLFAGVLGIIFTKIKILVIVSLMTMVIAKLLLFYAFLKSDVLHHHKPYHSVPFVKYTKDKYFIKHSPVEHAVVESAEPLVSHSPYHGHHGSSGVSYYRR